MADFAGSIDTGSIGFLNENFLHILHRHRRDSGNLIAGFVVEFVPFEILSAFNITPLLLPPGIFTGKRTMDWNSHPYDVLFCPEECTSVKELLPKNKTILHPSPKPDLYGQPFRVDLSRMLGSVITDITGKTNFAPDLTTLSIVTSSYNHIRRMIRGIATLRMEKPRLLTSSNLQLIFETALCLPADSVAIHLSTILDEMNRATHHEEKPRIRAMVYGSLLTDPTILDGIEQAGFLIVEDDLCLGRRNFDLSHNTDSHDLYEEILDAFSYKPLCPCLRSQQSRYELLYRLAGNYGIETVILVDDPLCGPGRSHIGELRIRLMRAGIDPLIVTPENAGSEAGRYIAAASL